MLTCPQCGTTSITNPRLQLLYSSCCGHCLCSDCIHTLFATPSSHTKHTTTHSSSTTTPCPACSSPLTPRDFDPAQLSTQRYTKEVKLRQRLNRLLGSLTRIDFNNNDSEWEAWQEWKEDVVWLVVEGGKEDEKEGERQIDEWRKENKDKLEKAMARERENERRAQLKAEGKVKQPHTAPHPHSYQHQRMSFLVVTHSCDSLLFFVCVVCLCDSWMMKMWST